MKIEPLELEREVPRGAGISFWPFIDLCAIGLFAAVFGSKFVMAPGMAVRLPEVEEPSATISARFEVLTIDEVEGNEFIIFQERKLDLDGFAKLIRQRGPVAEGTDLLVRADSAVSWDKLARLLESARNAGYRHVQLPTEATTPEPERFEVSEE